ncbi:hypothetical protein [Paenibacillus silagei]|uniref:DUF4304 domain-containing protein n=1 Tax=Paenibacillus silagei TaxID=1670801 RepID=A0ABS4NRU4_9BACL|nr:hypothetical protein [Paenibacillus silagei]MBP2112768.1 hypothetical protein [Paenibacillus silagei]
MSEFSASYHLQTSDQQKVVELIRASNNKGFVFPESNGWVTFIVKGPAFGIRKSIVSLNPGLLVHYSYMEDHGWELSIFEKDEIISTYKCDWTDELIIQKDELDMVLLRELIMKQGNSIEDVEKAFDLVKYVGEEPPAYFIAKKLGLSYFEWLSADNIGDGSNYENLVIVD